MENLLRPAIFTQYVVDDHVYDGNGAVYRKSHPEEVNVQVHMLSGKTIDDDYTYVVEYSDGTMERVSFEELTFVDNFEPEVCYLPMSDAQLKAIYKTFARDMHYAGA